MADLQAAITVNRRAVDAFLDAARAIPPAEWATPRAPGKWSPGQVTEHVAIAYEQNRRMLHGTFTGWAMPWFQQLLARWLGLPQMLRRGDFGKGPFRAPDFLRPSESPVSSGALIARLEADVRDLEADVVAAAAEGRATLDHAVFGRLPLPDLLRFLSIHTNHHRPQLAVGAG